MNRRDFFKKIAGVASAAVVGTVASKAAVPSLSEGAFDIELTVEQLVVPENIETVGGVLYWDGTRLLSTIDDTTEIVY